MTSPHLHPGRWLGIDIGSARAKLCSFCSIASDGRGEIAVAFEKGAAGDDYPAINEKATLLDLERPATYLQPAIEDAVRRLLDGSQLVSACLRPAEVPGPTVIAIDAPVAFAQPGQPLRLTEKASTQTFSTPDRQTFEALLRRQTDAYLRVNVFWKCIALAVYGYLAERLGPDRRNGSSTEVAAWTCAPVDRPGEPRARLRETFPSDSFKRANGRDGTLSNAARQVLRATVAAPASWQAVGAGRQKPRQPTLRRLLAIRQDVDRELRTGIDALSTMHKRPAGYGDLWDAFACAFTACCEDHGAAELRGWSENAQEQQRLQAEGAILTVTCR